MKLYLVRHGEAYPETVDPSRPLTDKGKSETQKIANCLKQTQINIDLIVPREHCITKGLHEVRLTQANTAINEQRVIGLPWILTNLTRGGPGKLIAFAFDEIFERKLRVEARRD